MSRTSIVVSLALGAALAVPLAVSGADKPEALRLRAFAVDVNNGTRTRSIDIVIERWSTPEETQELPGRFDRGRATTRC